ncbi:LPD1 domain-containing protein [[Clostridium] innocuum]|uniref:LPD1 domain-containing protein n=1 Tax=Clostridium innocuum TaxID=1522 RepID=UPI001F572601|nr:LPD1 domain-containing protein [[Clostridium] innocuum]MCI2999302.1 hypothetical protein [[Clostridium] innocuum]
MIQDFGEKIGGAKKDLWRRRGLNVTDLITMTEKEKREFIKKENVWPKPDYDKMLQEGVSKRVIWFQKRIRDSTPAKPRFNPLKNPAVSQEEYITFMSKLSIMCENVKEEVDILNFYITEFAKEFIQPGSPTTYYVKILPQYEDTIDNKILKAVQERPGFNKIDKEIQKRKFYYSEEDKLLSPYQFLLYDQRHIYFKDMFGKSTLTDGCNYYYAQHDELKPNVWQSNTYFIVKSHTVVSFNHETLQAAKDFILKNVDTSPTSEKRNIKGAFKIEYLENIVRRSPGMRETRYANGNMYLQDFGFRGGEFGNWLSEKERQISLNFGYDALIDLCAALQIDKKDISLGGRLAIAFGARGRGSAMAHYEPLLEVINLTKLRGAGCLAHEWAHALDDILSESLMMRISNGGKGIMLELMNAMKYDENLYITKYYEGSKYFDEVYRKCDKGYWCSNEELFARAFSCYIEDKLEDMGIRNDYLCGQSDIFVTKNFESGEIIRAYPIDEERKKINICFDKLMEYLKEQGLLHVPCKDSKLKEMNSLSYTDIVPGEILNDDTQQMMFDFENNDENLESELEL